MKIMERKYRCKNGVIERTRYAVGDNATARGKRKKGNTSYRKQEANFNGAIRKSARILNCNFTAEQGYFIGLDYDREGLQKLLERAQIAEEDYLRLIGTAAEEAAEETEELLQRLHAAAEHELRLWSRRLKRAVGKLKLYGVTAEQAGALGCPCEPLRDACRVSVPDTAAATELILKYPELFRDYEITKGKMDDVFLAVTGKKLTGGAEK